MASSSGAKVIYDFGSNNGDDIPYYLLKADQVIAVEANPELCDLIQSRFQGDINSGRLEIVNAVLTVDDDETYAPFYIHRTNHVQSQFPRPREADMHLYDEVRLPSRNVVSIIEKFGAPYYIKIDIEHYDQVILKTIFDHGIRPPHMSAESHSAEVFALMLAVGGYQSFNLVDGESVSTCYGEAAIQTEHGSEHYAFPFHSAGPFGEDIASPWLTPDNFLYLLAFEHLGWKDIHVSNVIPADPTVKPYMKSYFRKALIRKGKALLGMS